MLPPAADLPQKVLISQRIPRMRWIAVDKQLAIRAQAFRIQIIQTIAGQDAVIPAVLHLLGQHALDLFIRQGPVTLIQASVGIAAKRIGRQIHRPLLTPGAGYFHHQQRLALHRTSSYIFVAQQVDADLLAVVQVVEQLGTQLVGGFNASHLEPALALAHAQNHHPTIGIGHCAVGGPEILRQRSFAITALGQLAFQ